MLKKDYGQYFTTDEGWLLPQVVDFILSTGKTSVLDPFAGTGCLLKTIKHKLGLSGTGYDIDPRFGYACNDSLLYIPATDSIVITNPPYLAKNSAWRQRSPMSKYFQNNEFTDLYQIALNNCLLSHDYVVAIIPETFILADKFQNYINQLSVIEKNLFTDTDCPICVCCFDKNNTEPSHVYKDTQYLFTLDTLLNKRKNPNNSVRIKFNAKNGNIGLRAIDGTDVTSRIKFCDVAELNYNLAGIKHSSRSVSVLDVDVENAKEIMTTANQILEEYRTETCDLLFAAFKGNNKAGKRRRRLDFRTARAILEEAKNVSEV